MNPLDSNALVPQPYVLGLARGSREAKYVETVINGNNNEILCVREVFAVIKGGVRVSNIEA